MNKFIGFIYTILICIACFALWKALKVIIAFRIGYENSIFMFQTESGYSTQFGKSFEISIFDPFFTDPFLLLKDRWRRNLGKYFQ